ncbi:MAG TPA: hypothetical protein VGJ21_23395 [Terracidiphilus sp.]|jgi:hypothetical protein
MRSTLSKFFLVPVIAAAAMIGQSAHAQRINVPFEFTALGHTFPAGTYNVQKDVSSNFVSMRAEDNRNVVTKVLGPGSSDQANDRIVLRFAMDGDDHVLESIQYGAKITPKMSTTKSERHEMLSRPLRGQ